MDRHKAGSRQGKKGSGAGGARKDSLKAKKTIQKRDSRDNFKQPDVSQFLVTKNKKKESTKEKKRRKLKRAKKRDQTSQSEEEEGKGKKQKEKHEDDNENDDDEAEEEEEIEQPAVSEQDIQNSIRFIHEVASGLSDDAVEKLLKNSLNEKSIQTLLLDIITGLPTGPLRKILHANLKYFARALKKECENRSKAKKTIEATETTVNFQLKGFKCVDFVLNESKRLKSSPWQTFYMASCMNLGDKDQIHLALICFLHAMNQKLKKEKNNNEETWKSLHDDFDRVFSHAAVWLPVNFNNNNDNNNENKPVLDFKVEKLVRDVMEKTMSPMAAVCTQAFALCARSGELGQSKTHRYAETTLSLLNTLDAADVLMYLHSHDISFPLFALIRSLEATRPTTQGTTPAPVYIRHIRLIRVGLALETHMTVRMFDKICEYRRSCQSLPIPPQLSKLAPKMKALKLMTKSDNFLSRIQTMLDACGEIVGIDDQHLDDVVFSKEEMFATLKSKIESSSAAKKATAAAAEPQELFVIDKSGSSSNQKKTAESKFVVSDPSLLKDNDDDDDDDDDGSSDSGNGSDDDDDDDDDDDSESGSEEEEEIAPKNKATTPSSSKRTSSSEPGVSAKKSRVEDPLITEWAQLLENDEIAKKTIPQLTKFLEHYDENIPKKAKKQDLIDLATSIIKQKSTKQ